MDLTRLEFDLLAHFVESPRRVHTRRQLVGALWPTGTDARSRSVDVHVRRLRAKLGAPWAESLVTVRGVGYRWTPPTHKEPTDPARRSRAEAAARSGQEQR